MRPQRDLTAVLMIFLVAKQGLPCPGEVGKARLKGTKSAGKAIAEIAILLASVRIVV